MVPLVARSLIVGWTLAGLVLAIRGGLTSLQPAPAWQLVLATLLLLGCASSLRMLWSTFSVGTLGRSAEVVLGPLPGVALFTYWLVLLAGRADIASLIIFLAVLHEACWFAASLYEIPFRSSSAVKPRRPAAAAAAPTAHGLEPPEEADDADLTLRRRHVDGVDQIQGAARLRFEPGQRTASMPIGFAPPLVPGCDVEAEPVAGADVAVRILDPSAVGFMLEARRSGTTDASAETLVEFFAVQHPVTISDPRMRTGE